MNKEFCGISLTPTLRITHLLFVDDVLIFYNGLQRDAETLCDIIDLFFHATGMMINERNSTLSFQNLEKEKVEIYKNLFPFEARNFEDGLKYFGFHLKPNSYENMDVDACKDGENIKHP